MAKKIAIWLCGVILITQLAAPVAYSMITPILPPQG